MDAVSVSVYCLAYNHEKYIRKALEGFVRQKTDFPFEVIVHDDASADGTAAIIRAYVKKYPALLHPVFQAENQWSQGVSIVEKHILPRVSGRYIAICEGDDYWTDPHKLQKQYDYMEAHPDCPMCFTNAVILDGESGARRTFIPYTKTDARRFDPAREDYGLQDMYRLTFVPTCSFFFRRSCYEALVRAPVRHCPVDDLRLRLFMASRGPVHYSNEKTCVYRENRPGSLMRGWREQDRAKSVRDAQRNYGMLSDLDRYTGYRYHRELLPFMGTSGAGMVENAPLMEIFRNPVYREIFGAMRPWRKVRALMRAARQTGGIF